MPARETPIVGVLAGPNLRSMLAASAKDRALAELGKTIEGLGKEAAGIGTDMHKDDLADIEYDKFNTAKMMLLKGISAADRDNETSTDYEGRFDTHDKTLTKLREEVIGFTGEDGDARKRVDSVWPALMTRSLEDARDRDFAVREDARASTEDEIYGEVAAQLGNAKTPAEEAALVNSALTTAIDARRRGRYDSAAEVNEVMETVMVSAMKERTAGAIREVRAGDGTQESMDEAYESLTSGPVFESLGELQKLRVEETFNNAMSQQAGVNKKRADAIKARGEVVERLEGRAVNMTPELTKYHDEQWDAIYSSEYRGVFTGADVPLAAEFEALDPKEREAMQGYVRRHKENELVTSVLRIGSLSATLKDDLDEGLRSADPERASAAYRFITGIAQSKSGHLVSGIPPAALMHARWYAAARFSGMKDPRAVARVDIINSQTTPESRKEQDRLFNEYEGASLARDAILKRATDGRLPELGVNKFVEYVRQNYWSQVHPTDKPEKVLKNAIEAAADAYVQNLHLSMVGTGGVPEYRFNPPVVAFKSAQPQHANRITGPVVQRELVNNVREATGDPEFPSDRIYLIEDQATIIGDRPPYRVYTLDDEDRLTPLMVDGAHQTFEFDFEKTPEFRSIATSEKLRADTLAAAQDRFADEARTPMPDPAINYEGHVEALAVKMVQETPKTMEALEGWAEEFILSATLGLSDAGNAAILSVSEAIEKFADSFVYTDEKRAANDAEQSAAAERLKEDPLYGKLIPGLIGATKGVLRSIREGLSDDAISIIPENAPYVALYTQRAALAKTELERAHYADLATRTALMDSKIAHAPAPPGVNGEVFAEHVLQEGATEIGTQAWYELNNPKFRTKAGVDVDGMTKETQDAAAVARLAMRMKGFPFTLTSGAEAPHRGTSRQIHKDDSYHYKRRAFDFRTKHMEAGEIDEMRGEIQSLLGEAWQVLKEDNPQHMHIEPAPGF